MKLPILIESDKLLLSTADIASLLSINKNSAEVSASRYVKKGYLERLKRDLFILPQKLKNAKEEELFEIANLLQTPSYISLTTALSYYNLTTQQQKNYIESVALKRTNFFLAGDFQFTYTLIKDELYKGFTKNEKFFIAEPEKALVDSIYLTAIGRYKCDFTAVDFEKFDYEKINSYLKFTNTASINLWQELCKTYKP